MTKGAVVDSLVLAETESFTLGRRGRFLTARLHGPHLTLSTSHVNGGQSESVRSFLNHQSCESKGHTGRHDELKDIGQAEYHRRVCSEAGIEPESGAVMGTAANMQYASVREETFAETTVWAAVTAGVQGNAGRAGDPATWHESSGEWKPLHALPGTINTMVLFNWPLTPSALTRAAATITEAKTAVLHELAVGSRSSPHLATGTGTDQFCLAAPMDSARVPKTWTGKHSKLGEILARAVMEATREALRWQNGLEPSRTRNLIHALGRFGVEEASLLEAACAHLGEKDAALLRANFQAVIHEPLVAGAAYALASVRDRITFGTLPEGSGRESLAGQAALMAAGLAARHDAFPAFRAALLAEGADLPALAAKALALGWREKWI